MRAGEQALGAPDSRMSVERGHHALADASLAFPPQTITSAQPLHATCPLLLHIAGRSLSTFLAFGQGCLNPLHPQGVTPPHRRLAPDRKLASAAAIAFRRPDCPAADRRLDPRISKIFLDRSRLCQALLDRRMKLSAGRISPSFFTKQIAYLTVTRTRCSIFGHGSVLRRQERRAAVGLGQASR